MIRIEQGKNPPCPPFFCKSKGGSCCVLRVFSIHVTRNTFHLSIDHCLVSSISELRKKFPKKIIDFPFQLCYNYLVLKSPSRELGWGKCYADNTTLFFALRLLKVLLPDFVDIRFRKPNLFLRRRRLG